MMPTFPRSSLSFRTAGFPQYGWKAGLSRRGLPEASVSLSLLPACAVRRPVCIRPSCTSWSLRWSRSVSGRGLDSAPPLEGDYSYRPRGPRSGPGCSVPVRHHLIGPIRPTRRHIAISPHGGLYAMPSLCGSAEATREWFRAFTAHSFLACRPLRPRGVRHRYPEIRCRHWPSPIDHRLGTPDTPAIRFTRAVDFVASLVRFRYSLPGCSPPCTDQTGTPSLRGLLLPGFQRIGLPPRCWI